MGHFWMEINKQDLIKAEFECFPLIEEGAADATA